MRSSRLSGKAVKLWSISDAGRLRYFPHNYTYRKNKTAFFF